MDAITENLWRKFMTILRPLRGWRGGHSRKHGRPAISSSC